MFVCELIALLFQKWPSQDDCERMDPKEVHYLRKKHLTEITVLCINALIECFKNFDHFFGKFDEQVLFHLMCKSFLEVSQSNTQIKAPLRQPIKTFPLIHMYL